MGPRIKVLPCFLEKVSIEQVRGAWLGSWAMQSEQLQGADEIVLKDHPMQNLSGVPSSSVLPYKPT